MDGQQPVKAGGQREDEGRLVQVEKLGKLLPESFFVCSVMR
jgi:hypothetical protein